MADAMSGTSMVPTRAQSTLLDNLTRLTIFRQMGIMVGLAASVALGFAVVLWSRETTYQTLVTQPDPQAAAQIGALMEQSHIDYRIDPDTGVIMVDAHRVNDAKLKLGSSGLMPNPNPGYELLDNNQFGSSQFMETARYYRSVEGELARTITSMAGVREARVHLAIPKRSVFVGDTQRPSASVFVALLGTQTLERSQVAAIVHLVASSVPDMQPQDVTLVDQSGHLLSNDLSDPSELLSAHQLDYQKTVETDLKKRVESILTPILGLGGFHVELSANMDFSKVEQTSENFNPDQPALRSEQTVAESQGAGAGVQGVPGALSNQPPPAGQAPVTTNAASQPKNGAAAGGAGGAGNANSATSTASSPSGSSREQATKNFELDRTVSHVQEQVGVVKRLSVAVVVDNMPSTATGPKSKSAPKRIPLTQQELDKLTLLVKDAVGFDAARGDQVSMVNQPFIDINALASQGALPAEPFWQQDWFLTLTKQVLGAIFVLVLVLAVLRPIMKNLSVRQSSDGGEGGMPGEDSLPELNLRHDTHADGSKVTLSGEANDLLLPGPHEGFESQLAAVKAMIAEDPGRVAQVVKGWINAEES
ncbi:MAG: flagellar M-ring protein FliF [Pseudomonadales bacterium]|nr:flagellar M-ring protein FliF [Pseudomonadales bacterium]